ncbi:MAG: ABC transporter substrate-binding protein [Nannocystaceae bacterium]|nr:ABC transporter substrate-binding protein [Nannocystaceae bacterium]
MRTAWFAVGLLSLAGCPRPSAQAPTAVRIASVTIDSDATLWALGEEVRGKVVAVSALVDDARYSPIPGTWPADIPRVKGTSESLLALQPSVAFLAEWSDPSGRALLAQSNIEVVVLSGYGGFEDYRARVAKIAQATDAVSSGETLIEAFDESLRAARSRAGAGLSIVSYASGNVAAAGTTFADEAEAAGFVNLPSREGLEGHPGVSLEQLVAWQPAVIVIPCEADCTQTEAAFAQQPGVDATPAAKQDRIIAIEGPLLFATGPRMLEVTRALTARIEEASR